MFTLFLCAAGLLPQPPQAPRSELVRAERVGLCMGTRLHAELNAPAQLAQPALEAAWQALAAAEERLSTWETFGPATGVLARANAAAPGAWVPCDALTAAELARARAWSSATCGAFSPSCGAWLELYDLRGRGRWPGPEELATLRGADTAAFELGPQALRRNTAATRFEEGGFGKGAGLDAALASLRERGVADALLDLGGQVAALGPARWIELADPDVRGRPVARLRIANASVATTGNSERARDVAGRRLGHVLDPRSGLPARDWGALAVRAPSALDADCLSTGMFVLGPDHALAFAAAHPGIDVVCLERAGASVRVRASANLASDLQLIAPDGRATEPMKSVLTSLSVSVPILTGLVAQAQQTSSQPAVAQEAAAPQAQKPGGSVESRLAALETENAELKRRMDALGGEIETLSIGSVVGPLGPGKYGLGPAASKVYGVQQGLSIGGYGELLYQDYAGTQSDQLDLQRAVLYFGYRFDEHFVLNTEIEYEHANTDEGEVAVEFATLDWLLRPEFNLRAGLLLVPLGLVNELHEPTAYLSAKRSLTETFLVPSTWRENGIGVFGDVGALSYRAYIVNGFDASGFDATGLRGGRQEGATAVAEDFALAARLDWNATHGIDVGIGAYHGDSGQDLLDAGGDSIDATTTILEAHVDARWRGWRGRALIARADVDDAEDLNAALGLVGSDSIGEQLTGQYVEIGYDLMPHLSDDARQSLTPYVRWEQLDTQDQVPSGFAANDANDRSAWTFGVQWRPIDQIVVKLDYQDFDDEADSALDQWNLLVGYVF